MYSYLQRLKNNYFRPSCEIQIASVPTTLVVIVQAIDVGDSGGSSAEDLYAPLVVIVIALNGSELCRQPSSGPLACCLCAAKHPNVDIHKTPDRPSSSIITHHITSLSYVKPPPPYKYYLPPSPFVSMLWQPSNLQISIAIHYLLSSPQHCRQHSTSLPTRHHHHTRLTPPSNSVTTSRYL